MKTHELKLNINFCDDVLYGNKSFEIRFNDRNYESGDLIKFIPVRDNGEPCYHEIGFYIYGIMYVLDGWGLKDGYVVFSIKKLHDRRLLPYTHFYNELCQKCNRLEHCLNPKPHNCKRYYPFSFDKKM